MPVLYQNQAAIPEDSVSPKTIFDGVFDKVSKFRFLIPLFPKSSEILEKFYYKQCLITVFSFSAFFYLFFLFFVYLGFSESKHIVSFELVAFGWLLMGICAPAGIYRIIIIILKKRHFID